MKKSKEILTVLCCLLFTINFAFAQGKGQGQGQGLLNNTGCENGKGFTIGQGHILGKSAVECPEESCIQESIALAVAWIESNTVYQTSINGPTTFAIFFSTVGQGRDGCYRMDGESTGDPEIGCDFVQVRDHAPISCD